MKLRKNEKMVVSKYAEVKRVKERTFYGVVNNGGQDKIITVIAEYMGQATRMLKREAKKIGAELKLVRAFK